MCADYFPMQVRLMVGLLKTVGIGDLTTVDVVNINVYCDKSGI